MTARHSNRFRVSVNTSPHRLIDDDGYNYDDDIDEDEDEDEDEDDSKAISPMRCFSALLHFTYSMRSS